MVCGDEAQLTTLTSEFRQLVVMGCGRPVLGDSPSHGLAVDKGRGLPVDGRWFAAWFAWQGWGRVAEQSLVISVARLVANVEHAFDIAALVGVVEAPRIAVRHELA